MKDRPKTVYELSRLLNRDDIHNIQYSIRKLLEMGLIEKSKDSTKKAIAYQTTPYGISCTNTYREARRSILVDLFKDFDEAWMRRAFAEYWQHAQFSTSWSNLLLTPPQPHVEKLLLAACKYQAISNKFAHGFEDPSSLFPWITDSELTNKMINSYSENQFEAAST